MILMRLSFRVCSVSRYSYRKENQMSYPRHLCDQCSKAMRCVKSQKGCTAGDFSCFVKWLDDPAGTVKADLIHTERIIRSADKL